MAQKTRVIVEKEASKLVTEAIATLRTTFGLGKAEAAEYVRLHAAHVAWQAANETIEAAMPALKVPARTFPVAVKAPVKPVAKPGLAKTAGKRTAKVAGRRKAG